MNFLLLPCRHRLLLHHLLHLLVLLLHCRRPCRRHRHLPILLLQVSEEDQSEFPSLHEPANGWGMGPHPEWMEQSSLRFNEAAKRAFASLQLAPGQPLMLVFGGASVNDMLRNWAIHVQKLEVPYAVACMDEKLFTLADDFGMPGVMMIERGGEQSKKEVTTRWKYFRMDPRAFMTMGILKVLHPRSRATPPHHWPHRTPSPH